MTRVSILTCFSPPEENDNEFVGDFGWVSGFTANPEILEQIADRFTSGERRRRPSLAAFLHPSDRHLPLVRGVTIPFRRPAVGWGFNLLHAKVALLHFRSKRDSLLRLVVSTGNWTHDPISTSLDIFWIAEWRSDAPDQQAASDILAAGAMFEWLREKFDTSVLELDLGSGSVEASLRKALGELPSKHLPPPRFMDTREEALDEQILKALRKETGKCRRLIMGSGYFETGEDAQVGVLKSFVDKLIAADLATKSCSVELVLNPDACQGLAEQSDDLANLGWILRRPLSSEMPGAKLHAKFIFGASGTRTCTNPWCYIGSGNLSSVGFARSVVRGNLEAGVLFFPEEILTWEKGADHISSRLPVDFESKVEPSKLRVGDPYEPPGAPAEPPPVAYLQWRDGILMLPDGFSNIPTLLVRLPDGSWAPLPAGMTEAPSVAVLGPMMAEVPVLTDGGFVLPPLGPRRVEDVLQALKMFPKALPDERDREEAGEVAGDEDTASPCAPSSDYPLRRMMRLMVRLSEWQAKVDLRDWELWLNRLEESLLALSEPEHEMICAIRTYRCDPLSMLLHPKVLPLGLSDLNVSRLLEVIARIRKAWGLEGLDELFPVEQVA